MTTTAQTTDRRQRTGIGAAGLGAVLAFAGSILSFPDPLGGSGSAAEAARRLEGTAVDRAVLLVGVYVLLATVVLAALTAALPDRSAARRMVPVLGVAHLFLFALSAAGLGAARAVGDLLGGVSPAALEAGLVVSNAAFSLAQWAGAAFGVAVFLASRSADRLLRGLGVTAVVIALGLLVPPVAWIVLYLTPVWFAVTGVLLAVRNR
ncbi:hypothetical protein [Geodermatophilus maliterrae]|uniref:DUF4386 family protein n=1 Tax=Geodermatophilus maliterrae TaxID=3162531 RepID=A0ABV3XJD2_9ACTN